MLNIEAIFRALPHRFPFVMIDRIVDFEPGKKVVAVKNVSMNEGFFKGHFPGAPIMPGVLIIEAMAQASIMLFEAGKDTEQSDARMYYLGSVKMRFLHPVLPGDQLTITIEPLKIVASAVMVKAHAQVSGRDVATGEIGLMAKSPQ